MSSVYGSLRSEVPRLRRALEALADQVDLEVASLRKEGAQTRQELVTWQNAAHAASETDAKARRAVEDEVDEMRLEVRQLREQELATHEKLQSMQSELQLRTAESTQVMLVEKQRREEMVQDCRSALSAQLESGTSQLLARLERQSREHAEEMQAGRERERLLAERLGSAESALFALGQRCTDLEKRSLRDQLEREEETQRLAVIADSRRRRDHSLGLGVSNAESRASPNTPPARAPTRVASKSGNDVMHGFGGVAAEIERAIAGEGEVDPTLQRLLSASRPLFADGSSRRSDYYE